MLELLANYYENGTFVTRLNGLKGIQRWFLWWIIPIAMLYVCYTIPSATTAFEIRDIASDKISPSNC